MKKKIQSDVAVPPGDKLLEIIRAQARPLRLDNILKICHLPRHVSKTLHTELDKLQETGALHKLPGGSWICADRLKSLTGIFSFLPEGGGSVLPEGREKAAAISIPPGFAHGTWAGDLVRIGLIPGTHGKQGRVLQILEQASRKTFARVEACSSRLIRCRPTARNIPVIFELFPEKPDPAIHVGSLLSIVAEKEIGRLAWSAKLLNVFGDETNTSVQESIVKSSHPVPAAFPALALEQATLACGDAPTCGTHRADLRTVPFVTIDGADAKDFDDAIHVEQTNTGWRLQVAIADVAHYVRPDGLAEGLDQEAFRRGNSWYFPRSVEPMLPEQLSNGLCSLRPGEDRLAMLVTLDIDREGNVSSSAFAQILMRSAARLTYDEVEEFFVSGQPQGAIQGPTASMLTAAHELYLALAAMRQRRGTLDFDLPEPAYKFAPDGALESMSIARRGDANRLIEEFMIAANEAVARFLGSSGLPFLYRVHPEPTEQKLTDLYQTLRHTSLESLPPGIGSELPAQAIQGILMRSVGTPAEYVVNKLVLRSMQQARYQPDNVGHFGLASADYCHFTSPIRRYADLLTHRALKVALGVAEIELPDKKELVKIGDELNKREREALECERDMARRLGCIAVKQLEGETTTGIISAVTDFGVFVELSHIPTEGLMRLSTLGNDWFELQPEKQQLIGRHTGKTWRLGQSLEIRVAEVNLDRLEIRLEPSGADAPSHPGTRNDRNRTNGRAFSLPAANKSDRRKRRPFRKNRNS